MMATSNTGRGAVICTYEVFVTRSGAIFGGNRSISCGGVRRNVAGKNRG